MCFPARMQRSAVGIRRVLLGFHRHGLKTGNGQQLVRGHPVQPLVAVALQGFLAQCRIVLRDADDLEKIRQFAQRPDFVGVLVAGADLPDLDARSFGGKRILGGGQAARQDRRRCGKPGGGEKGAS